MEGITLHLDNTGGNVIIIITKEDKNTSSTQTIERSQRGRAVAISTAMWFYTEWSVEFLRAIISIGGEGKMPGPRPMPTSLEL